MTLTYQLFAEKLLVGILVDEESGESDASSLKAVCKNSGLPFNEDFLVRFLNENRSFGSGHTMGGYYFQLNREGRNEAQGLRAAAESRTLKGRLKSINRSDWIAAAALAISAIALFRQ